MIICQIAIINIFEQANIPLIALGRRGLYLYFNSNDKRNSELVNVFFFAIPESRVLNVLERPIWSSRKLKRVCLGSVAHCQYIGLAEGWRATNVSLPDNTYVNTLQTDGR